MSSFLCFNFLIGLGGVARIVHRAESAAEALCLESLALCSSLHDRDQYTEHEESTRRQVEEADREVRDDGEAEKASCSEEFSDFSHQCFVCAFHDCQWSQGRDAG